MLHLEKFKDFADIKECVDIYLELNDESFIPSNRDVSYSNLFHDIKDRCPARVIYDDNEIVGFILAGFNKVQFSLSGMLIVKFYVSNLVGFKSARAAWLSHQYLIDVAEGAHVGIVMTQASPFDADNNLCKILKKKGWDTRGHTAIYKTKYYDR